MALSDREHERFIEEGIEESTGMGGEVLECGLGAQRCTEWAGRHERDKGLCRAQNAAAQWDLVPGESAGVATPIPMFVMSMHEIDDVRMEA